MPKRNKDRYTPLGHGIDAILDERDISQTEAGRRMVAQGLERADGGDVLNNLMRGVTKPSLEIVLGFSRALDLSPEQTQRLIDLAAQTLFSRD